MKQLMLSLIVCLIGDATAPDVDTWIKILVPALVGLLSKLMDIHQRRWEKRQKLKFGKERKLIHEKLKIIKPDTSKTS